MLQFPGWGKKFFRREGGGQDCTLNVGDHRQDGTCLQIFMVHILLTIPLPFVLGCFYDFHMLDMFELGIEKYKPLSDFKVKYFILFFL